MNASELVPKPTQKQQFNLRELMYYPVYGGCYVLTDFNGSILYVGLAQNIRTRISQHLENKEKVGPTQKGKIFWAYFLQYDLKNLPKLERTWINQYLNRYGNLPILNKANSPIS